MYDIELDGLRLDWGIHCDFGGDRHTLPAEHHVARPRLAPIDADPAGVDPVLEART